ncbi:RNA polymerase II [Metasolibacillus meyeri]|uniref:RNA polymerase II n=1 Tax=Metasolibacillus meyeri TaxID=1071052 RepID=A0AAW9NXY6_9BACL|nr:RNA polymerase II [Metasolibacillus meyeri]MEC1179468.1 RNA polymerase II [Metasolibacillus meyeri]
MKFAVSFFVILVSTISALLFMQFQVYSDQIDLDEHAFNYSQEIEIVYRGESLDIRHHFKNLPNDDVTIVWPSKAENPNCFIETEYSCSRLSEDLNTFNSGENRTQSLSYIIPLNGGLKSNHLMEDLFIKLKNGTVKFSTVHISTDSDIGGQWVTGLPLIGQQSLSLVNYSMFSGEGEVQDLYWRAGNLALQQVTNTVSVYAKNPTSTAFNEKLAQLKFLNDEHIAVVEGENNSKLQGERILFLPQITTKQIQQHVIFAQLNAMYDFVDTPRWIKEVVASYLTGSSLGGERATAIIQTLTNQMTDEQLKKWHEQLEALRGKEVTPSILDEALSTVFGIHTSYFSLNVNSNEIFPFLFNDKRDVYIDGEQQETIDVIFKDGLVLYSAQELLNELGYSATKGPRGYYVESETRAFRFPNEPGFYVFNQRRYNAISEPIVQVAGQYYIEETWLQRLFLVEIQKTEENINLLTTEIQ